MRKLADFLWFVGEVFRDLSIRLHAWVARRDVAPPLAAQFTFERLCFDCAPNVDWNPMARGECQHCGRYAFLMAFRC